MAARLVRSHRSPTYPHPEEKGELIRSPIALARNAQYYRFARHSEGDGVGTLKTTPHGKSRIRRSTDADLRAIHAWLVDQEDKNVPGSFLCNWIQIKNSHKKGNLIVYVDGESKQPVAYQFGGLVHPGILEVRCDMRGKGIGSRLVRHRIAQARKHDQPFLVIQCEPSSSIPFWKRMGFTLNANESGKNLAYRILEKKHRLPLNGTRVKVVVRFFQEYRKWDEWISLCSVTMPDAVQTPDGVIHLDERVLFFCELHPDSSDPFIEVDVANQIRFRGKAKYREAKALGVKRCDHGFFLDHPKR